MKSAKLIVILSVIMMTLMVLGCGKDDQGDIDQQFAYGYGPNGYGADCNSLTSRNDYRGGYGAYRDRGFQAGYDRRYQTGYDSRYRTGYPYGGAGFRGNNPGDYPDAGRYLSNNPQSTVRFQDRCYEGWQMHDMVSDYYYRQGYDNVPWNRLGDSPFRSASLYMGQNADGGRQGSISFSNNESYSANWQSLDDMWSFDGSAGGPRSFQDLLAPRDRIGVRVKVWGKDK